MKRVIDIGDLSALDDVLEEDVPAYAAPARAVPMYGVGYVPVQDAPPVPTITTSPAIAASWRNFLILAGASTAVGFALDIARAVHRQRRADEMRKARGPSRSGV